MVLEYEQGWRTHPSRFLSVGREREEGVIGGNQ